jgi:hypothetical protein
MLSLRWSFNGPSLLAQVVAGAEEDVPLPQPASREELANGRDVHTHQRRMKVSLLGSRQRS